MITEVKVEILVNLEVEFRTRTESEFEDPSLLIVNAVRGYHVCKASTPNSRSDWLNI